MEHIKIAFSQYDIKETKGEFDNPEVLKYFNDLGFNGSKLKDETAWCAAFVNYCLKRAGYGYIQGKLNARALIDVGETVDKPELGDVVVLWRSSPDSWKGHTGFFIRETSKWIYILGGNQGNKVCIKAYPKSRLLGYVRPCLNIS